MRVPIPGVRHHFLLSAPCICAPPLPMRLKPNARSHFKNPFEMTSGWPRMATLAGRSPAERGRSGGRRGPMETARFKNGQEPIFEMTCSDSFNTFFYLVQTSLGHLACLLSREILKMLGVFLPPSLELRRDKPVSLLPGSRNLTQTCSSLMQKLIE